MQDFLTNPNKALRFEQTANARTYLLMNEIGDILAYFSLTFKQIELSNVLLSKSEIKRIDGINKNAKETKAYLIGQLGKNENIKNDPINLGDILSEAYEIIRQVRNMIGGLLIILECEDNIKLIQLYQSYQFQLLELKETNDNLKTLYTFF